MVLASRRPSRIYAVAERARGDSLFSLPSVLFTLREPQTASLNFEESAKFYDRTCPDTVLERATETFFSCSPAFGAVKQPDLAIPPVLGHSSPMNLSTFVAILEVRSNRRKSAKSGYMYILEIRHR